MRLENSARNIKTAWMWQLVHILCQFAARTVIIKVLTIEYVGLSGLFSNVLTMLSLAELGIGEAIVFSLYIPIARNEHRIISPIMKFYQKVYVVVGTFIAVAGYLLEKEIKFLGDAVDNPVRPFVAILGGSKVSSKIGVINHLLEKADKVIVGGGMTYTFYKAKGIAVGSSLVEDDKVELAKELIEKAGDKLVLPVDNVVADKFANDAEYKTVEGDIPDGYMALDVGEKSVELFKETLKDAKTVVWNGPMGVFEMPNFAKGTLALGEFLATLSDATTIVGGGDSVAAAKQLGIADKLSHVSTGGCSSLEYLEGKTLPAIAVLSEK